MDVGACVVAYLASPREHVFGVVLSLSASGVVLRGMSLASLDEWMRGLSVGQDGVESVFDLATTFYPMHRVEKIVLDEPVGGLPTIRDRFRERTGLEFDNYVRGLAAGG